MKHLSEHVIYEIEITPAEAKEIRDRTLEAGYNFRSSAAETNKAVQKLAVQMRSGEWDWSDADPQRWSSLDPREAVCSDGLHRLTACAQTGIPLRTLVLVGDQWRAGLHAGRPKTRTLAQYLQHQMNIKNAAEVAAISRRFVARTQAVERNVNFSHSAQVFASDELILELIATNEDELQEIVKKTNSAYDSGLNRSAYGCFLFEILQIDPEMMEEFHVDLRDGPESPNDPLGRLLATSNRLMAKSGRRMTAGPTHHALVKAWDLRLKGESLKIWKAPFWDPEEVRFPEGFQLRS